MTTLNLFIHRLYIRYLQAHLVLAMASIAQEIVAEARQWDIRGPRCQQCNEHAGVPLVIIRQDGRTTLPEWEYIQLDHRKLRRLCYDCLQDLLEGVTCDGGNKFFMVTLYLMIPSSKAASHSTYGDPLASTNADVDIASKLGSIEDGPAGDRRRSHSI